MSSSQASQHPEESTQGGLDLLALWRSVRKYWVTALAVTLAVAGGVTFYTLGQKRIYQASATVMFDPTPPRPLGGRVEQVVELGSGSVWDTSEYYETQYQVIRSHRIAYETVLKHGLHKDSAFLQNVREDDAPLFSGGEVEPDVAADILRGRLSVVPVKGSRLATVHLEDADPERAAKVLRSLVEIYVERNVSDALESSTDATEWLATQEVDLKEQLETSEEALHKYKEDQRLLEVEYADKSNMLREEIAQLNQTLTEVKAKRVEVAARRHELAKVTADDPLKLPASELINNSLLAGLKSDYQAALRDRDALLSGGKGAQHPEVLAATARVDLAKVALLAEVRNIQGAVDRDLAIVSAQEGGLHGLLEQSKTEALKLARLEIAYNRLNRTKQNNEKLYDMVLERAKEASLTQRMLFNNIRVVDQPRAPGSPIRPRVPLNVGAGVFVGLLLGVGAAFGRGMLDRTIKTPTDVEQRLRANFLGLIPETTAPAQVAAKRPGSRRQMVLGTPELAVHEEPMGGVAEAARSVRTNLMFMAPDNPYRLLLVASAGPADGKTTVACCIATAMAQAGRRVLLIDCDLRRPRVHRIFGKSSDLGLTTALLEDRDDVVFDTGVPNLSVTVAGPIPPNPAELLQSEKFRHYLERVQERFDMILLDSPPLVAVTDAVVLSKLVDATVLVVRAHKTRIELAEHGLRSLSDVGATVAGVVLNAVNLDRDEYRYAYRYYRRGRYYAETEPESKTETKKKTRSGAAAAPPPP